MSNDSRRKVPTLLHLLVETIEVGRFVVRHVARRAECRKTLLRERYVADYERGSTVFGHTHLFSNGETTP